MNNRGPTNSTPFGDSGGFTRPSYNDGHEGGAVPPPSASPPLLLLCKVTSRWQGTQASDGKYKCDVFTGTKLTKNAATITLDDMLGTVEDDAIIRDAMLINTNGDAGDDVSRMKVCQGTFKGLSTDDVPVFVGPLFAFRACNASGTSSSEGSGGEP